MKKILFIFSLCGLILSGCEDFLDTENLTGKNTGNFPANETDVNDMLTSVYESIGRMEKSTSAWNAWMISEFLSDDRLAGGGTDDAVNWPPIENFAIVNVNATAGMWGAPYQAIYRANSVLAALDGITWSSQAVRDKIEGQTRFLRAYAFFNLARLFGTAQMPLTPLPTSTPRVTADELFGQIALDFKKAIELLPADKWSAANAANRARVTKWAAEAFMARAYLFYSGYYGGDMPLAAEGEEGAAGTVTKAQVIGWIDDCVNNSGHDLIDDFRELWPYTNSATNNPANNDDLVYPYVIENDLKWIGQEGANYETVFTIPSSPASAGWGDNSYANPIVLFGSPRQAASAPDGSVPTQDTYYPWGWGWGHGPVNSRLWDGWPAGDLRKEASILNVNNKEEMRGEYVWGAKDQVDETGYWQKKYISIMAPTGDYDGDGNPRVVNYGSILWGSVVSTNMQLGETQDMVTMRFADVLLMQSELKEDAAGINKVRARVNLEPIGAYSLEALKAERRYELAFEGVRYYDLLRWGIAEAAQAIITAENGLPIRIQNRETTKTVPANLAQRMQETGGFLPIPQTEIDLSGGVLEQTPGWNF
jgi:hypothetical protein